MNKLTQREEVKRILKELRALKDDPTLQPPPDGFDQAWSCYQDQQKKKSRFIRKRLVVEIILVAALISIIAVYAAPEKLREQLLNLHLQASNASSRVSLSSEQQDILWTGNHELSFLPEGFSAQEETGLQSSHVITYTKSAEEIIVFREAESLTAANVDTEALDEAKEVLVKQNKGLLTQKDQTTRLVWSESGWYFVLEIYDALDEISEDTVIKIAEGMKAVPALN